MSSEPKSLARSWVTAAATGLYFSSDVLRRASVIFEEHRRLDWWHSHSEDNGIRQREAARCAAAHSALSEFAKEGDSNAVLASRIYDKTAPNEFRGLNDQWYVPTDERTMRKIDQRSDLFAAGRAAPPDYSFSQQKGRSR